MDVVSDAPRGFSEAVSAINVLPQVLLVEMVNLFLTLIKRSSVVYFLPESRRHCVFEISTGIHKHFTL